MAYPVDVPESHSTSRTNEAARLHQLPAATVAYAVYAGSSTTSAPWAGCTSP